MMPGRAVLFDLLSGRAGWLAQRQAVLSENVANADTPDFQPLDLKAASFAQLIARRTAPLARLPLARTLPAHAAGHPAAAAGFRADKTESFEVAPAGNGVVLPEQLQKMAETELDYQLTTNLYRRYLGMMRTALGVPQGG